jgi:DNA-directed RNA polymerase specialized sigma24 family protein
MNESSGVSVPDSDAELLNTIRSGGPGAFDLLRARHEAAARSFAGNLEADPAAADDLVARAFDRVLAAIRRGGGPTDAFRPYLLTAIRRAALDAGSGESTRIPADEQQITDPGQLLTDPAAADLADSPVVAAFLALPERWRAVLWHTEVEGATPAEAASVLGLPAPGVAELANRARDGLAREYRQLQKAAGDGEHADLGDVGAALRSTVAPVILGETATAYLAGLAHPAAAPTPGTAAGSAPAVGALAGGAPAGGVAPGGPLAAGPAGSPGPARPVSAGVAVGPAGGWLGGKLRGTSPQQRTVAGGIAALLVIFAIGGYVLTLRPAAGSQQASGHPTAAGPPSPPAQVSSAPAAPASSPAAASSPDRSPSSPPSTTGPGTSPTSARPLVTASPPAPPPASQAPAPPRPTPSPRHPTSSPSKPGIPVPVPVLPQPTRSPAAQVTAQISVSGPVGFSNVVEVTFGITDTGPAATGQLTASITLPAGSTLMSGSPLAPGPAPAPDPSLTPSPAPGPTLTPGPPPLPDPTAAPDPAATPGLALLAGPALKLGSTLTAGWNGPGATGWTCSAEGTGAACVHGPIVAAAQTDGILAVMVTGSAACGQPVQVMVTGGTSASSAQSAGTIECGPRQPPSATARATAASGRGHEGTDSRSAGHEPGWGHGHKPGWRWPSTHWPSMHWPPAHWPSPTGSSPTWPRPTWSSPRWPSS